jgi:hypothetical protein
MKNYLFFSLILFGLTFKAHALSNFELSLNFGPSMAQEGNIQKLGDPNYTSGLELNYFWTDHQGFGMGWINEWDFEGTSKVPVEDGSITTFDLHYAYRILMGKFQFLLEPGLGVQTLYDNSADYYVGQDSYEDLSTGFILNYKLLARYVLKEWDKGSPSKNLIFVGAGFMQIFTTKDDLRGQDITGSRLSLLFQLGVGW